MSYMNQNNGMQKRMLVMTLVVFVFFIAYEFLVLKPQQEAKAELAKQEQAQKQNSAPDVDTSKTQMVSTDVSGNPADVSKSAEGLSSKTVASSQVISVIKTAKNIIEIDTLGRVAQVTLLEEKYKDENGNQIKLFESNQLRPLEVRFADSNTNAEAFKVSMTASSSNVDVTTSSQELVLTQNLSGTVLTKKFKIYPDGHYDLSVSSTNDKTILYYKWI